MDFYVFCWVSNLNANVLSHFNVYHLMILIDIIFDGIEVGLLFYSYYYNRQAHFPCRNF